MTGPLNSTFDRHATWHKLYTDSLLYSCT